MITNEFKNHIIGLVDLEPYNIESETPLNEVLNIFRSEYGFMINRIGLKKSIVQWLQGLPSCINIPFTYFDIINLMYATDMINNKNVCECETSDKYFNCIAEIIMNSEQIEIKF